MRSLLYAVFIIAALQAACTTTPPVAAPTEQEQKDVFFAYFACLQTQARKMDDGKSDASTIALVIRPMCVSEFERTVEMQGRNLNPAARQIFEEQVQHNQLEIATRAVLDERAKRR